MAFFVSWGKNLQSSESFEIFYWFDSWHNYLSHGIYRLALINIFEFSDTSQEDDKRKTTLWSTGTNLESEHLMLNLHVARRGGESSCLGTYDMTSWKGSSCPKFSWSRSWSSRNFSSPPKRSPMRTSSQRSGNRKLLPLLLDWKGVAVIGGGDVAFSLDKLDRGWSEPTFFSTTSSKKLLLHGVNIVSRSHLTKGKWKLLN